MVYFPESDDLDMAPEASRHHHGLDAPRHHRGLDAPAGKYYLKWWLYIFLTALSTLSKVLNVNVLFSRIWWSPWNFRLARTWCPCWLVISYIYGGYISGNFEQTFRITSWTLKDYKIIPIIAANYSIHLYLMHHNINNIIFINKVKSLRIHWFLFICNLLTNLVEQRFIVDPTGALCVKSSTQIVSLFCLTLQSHTHQLSLTLLRQEGHRAIHIKH